MKFFFFIYLALYRFATNSLLLIIPSYICNVAWINDASHLGWILREFQEPDSRTRTVLRLHRRFFLFCSSSNYRSDRSRRSYTSSTILPRVHFVYISFGIPVDTGVRRLHNNLIYGFMENLAVSAIEMSSDSYIYFVHTNSHDIEKAYVQKREPRFIPPPCLSWKRPPINIVP